MTQTVERRTLAEKRAFTLIEVLVVVAIIAMLTAILLPSLQQARNQTRTVHCSSHIRQLATGMQMYMTDFGTFPAHQWRITDDVRVRWFNAMARALGGMDVQSCPSTPEWEVGRNNSYGYNYKYLGSARNNDNSPKRPFESFPVKSVKSPSETIAFGDTDGTGWKKQHARGTNDVDMFGNHGYTLDPTYIPTYSTQTYNLTDSGSKEYESYAWHDYRTYISTRHLGESNLVFADGHVETLRPEQVYQDNRYWNGFGRENPTLDPHVDYRFKDGEWRFEF